MSEATTSQSTRIVLASRPEGAPTADNFRFETVDLPEVGDGQILLRVVGKRIDEIKLVCSGAGAAALACLDLLVDLGLPLANIWVTDIAGVVYEGRTELMDPDKARFAQRTDARTLDDIIEFEGVDMVVGDIEEVYVDEACMTSGRPDIDKLQLLMYLSPGGPYFVKGSTIAEAFKAGRDYRP